MKLNKVFKRTLTALAVSSIVISSHSVIAAQSTVDVTGQIKGRPPVITKLAAEGTLKVGSELSLPENYFKALTLNETVTDLDGDKPLSLWALNDLAEAGGKLHLEDAKIEWFIYDNPADTTTLGNLPGKNKIEYQALVDDGKIIPLTEFNGKVKITVPAKAFNKRIGFKVSARTETGNPIFAEPVYILNAYINDTDGPTDPKKDPSTPDGTVDKPDTYLVVQSFNTTSSTWDVVYDEKIDATTINVIQAPALGQKLRAFIKDEDGNSWDHVYQAKAVKWTFFVEDKDELDGVLVEDILAADPSFKKEVSTLSNGYKVEGTEDYFYLTIQTDNGKTNLPDGVSEQGYRLKIEVSEDEANLDYEAEKVNPASPLIALEPKVE